MSKPKKSEAPKAQEPKVREYPSVSTLALPPEIPEAIDLRPYTPELGDTYEHALSAALVATFARRGTPLPFAPSPEHLRAIGGHEGIGQYGVRELGVRMGEPPTEYDLTADAITLTIEVFDVDSTGDHRVNDVCAALAAGYVVRVGDAFVVAYGADGVVATAGPLTKLDDAVVQVWKVTRP
jgi:hypothetical protein